VENTNGVYLVPAFVGLGAPYWDPDARGILTGLTRGANRNHVIRAALESLAYQTCDVLGAMQKDTGKTIDTLSVDGGACANNFLMQFQADMAGCLVRRPEVIESTSLGAAFLAGLRSGFWRSAEELARLKIYEKEFKPEIDTKTKQDLLAGWEKAVRQVRVK
jgi:glycerol kinase